MPPFSGFVASSGISDLALGFSRFEIASRLNLFPVLPMNLPRFAFGRFAGATQLLFVKCSLVEYLSLL